MFDRKHKIDEMKKAYPDATEELPANAPDPLGNPVSIYVFVDCDHAGDKMTKYQTGIILYLKNGS